MVLLTLRVKNLDMAIGTIGKIRTMVNSSRKQMGTEALHGAAKVWERNFVGQGSLSGGWRPLAERTVEERERLGFGGHSPILIRYGHLKELVTVNLTRAHAGDTWARTDPQGKDIRVEVRAGGSGITLIASGDKASNQLRAKNRPPRPYWFTNKIVMEGSKDSVVHWLDSEVRRLVR